MRKPTKRKVAARRPKKRLLSIGGFPVAIAFTIEVRNVEGKAARIVRMWMGETARFTDVLSAAQNLQQSLAEHATKTADIPEEMRLELAKAAIATSEAFSRLPGARRVAAGETGYSSPKKEPE